MSEYNKNNTFTMNNFHHLNVSNAIDILSVNASGCDFFTAISLNYVRAILTIAKACRHIPVGARFEQQSGHSVDSPYWVSLVCNDADMRRNVVVNLASNLNIYKDLKSPDVMSALDLCNEDWENLQSSNETYERVIATINAMLDVFKAPRFIDNYAHMGDDEIYFEFTNSIINQDYKFFDNASEADRIRIFDVAKRTGIDSLSQESLKAFMTYVYAWSAKSQRS